MHVLFIPSWYPSSPTDIAGSFFREQAIMLHRTGVKVGVLAPKLHPLRAIFSLNTNDLKLNYESDNGVETYRVSRLHLTPRMWVVTAKFQSKLLKIMFNTYVSHHGMPDIIHIHASLPAGLGAIEIARKFDIPIVLSEHRSAFARNMVSESGINLAREIALSVTARFSVSTQFARLLESKLDLPPDFFRIMPNPVDDIFLNAPLIQKKSDDQNFQFLHVSRLDENKNVTQLIDAFKKAFLGNANFKLTIAGDGPERALLEARVRENGLSSQINFLGNLPRTKVLTAMQEADAFVLSSRFETFSIVIIEALATGLPVISTRCGGPEDIITKGDGILIDVDDTISMADAMRRLVADPGSLNRSERRDRCRLRFGPDAIIAEWMKIYTDAYTQHKSGRMQ